MDLGKNSSSFLQYDRISSVENYKFKKKKVRNIYSGNGGEKALKILKYIT